MAVGKLVRQPEGYGAFVPEPFPSKTLLYFPKEVLTKATTAEKRISKLDSITHVLPDALELSEHTTVLIEGNPKCGNKIGFKLNRPVDHNL